MAQATFNIPGRVVAYDMETMFTPIGASVAVLKDFSEQGNDGAVTGTPDGILGQVGLAKDFIDVGAEGFLAPYDASMDFTAGLTVSAWVNHNAAPGGTDYIVSRDDVGANRLWYLRWNVTNNIEFRVFTSTGNTTLLGTTTADTWVHWVGTWDGTNMNLYKDGTLVAGPTARGGTLLTSISIGLSVGMDAASSDTWDGSVDEVYIFNRAITADERAILGLSTDIISDPSELIKSLLLTNWTPANTDSHTPKFLSSSDPKVFSSRQQDVIKVYEDHPRIKNRIDHRFDYATYIASVSIQADIGNTPSGVTIQTHAGKVLNEVERILQNQRSQPDQYWDLLETDQFTFQHQFRNFQRNLMNCNLKRIVQLIPGS